MSSPTGRYAPGSPFPHGPKQPELVVAEEGDPDAGEGVRVTLLGDGIVFHASFEGAQLTFGFDIVLMLEAIQEFTRTHGS